MTASQEIAARLGTSAINNGLALSQTVIFSSYKVSA
jgi:hypothetical protein